MGIVRFWIIACCVIWVGAVGYSEVVVRGGLFEPSGSVVGSGASSCSGSFSSRYECRSSSINSSTNAVFIAWGKKIGFISLPPLMLLYLFGKYARRRENKQAERIRQAFLKKKRDQHDSGLEPTV